MMIKPMIKNYNEAVQRWKGKPYYSLNAYLTETFGQKIYKYALDGGFTCPNRDGTLGTRGCIFCSSDGSGDFAHKTMPAVPDGIPKIAYFQAFTSTYGPIEKLERCFTQAILHPDTAILSIATRPDCLSDDVINLLKHLHTIKPVWVELGLQTIHDTTAAFIRRGYPLEVFTHAVERLHEAGIPVIVHTILGLPGESETDILKTHRFLSTLPIQGVKLQLLHVLKGTDLNTIYEKSPFPIYTLEAYVDVLIHCIEVLPPDIVIHRITGDGPKHLLTAPLWSGHKKNVLNTIHHEFKIRNTWQGKYFQPDSIS